MSKPNVTIFYSIGLLTGPNRQTFAELREELEQAGYQTTVELRPPPTQFAQASLEHVMIVVGTVAAAGGAIFSKKFLELAADDAYKALRSKLSRLTTRRTNTDVSKLTGTEDVPTRLEARIVITVEVEGSQIKNLLAKGPDDIKEFPTRPDRPHGH